MAVFFGADSAGGCVDRSAADMLPTPVRSLTTNSLYSSSSTGVAVVEQKEKLKDVSLRIRGVEKMDVRGRRKRARTSDEVATEAKKQRRPADSNACAREEEVERWVAAAPSFVCAAFDDGLESMCRRLAAQPAHRLKVVLQKFQKRRASGDPDAATLAWMEAFVVSLLAYDFGVHIKKPIYGNASADCSSAADVTPKAVTRTRYQPLRISAGRAGAAAGIHPWTDAGELFLELLYQDLPELLLRDAALAGIDVISAADERERLMQKSASAQVLESILEESARALSVAQANDGRSAIANAVSAAAQAGSLSADEAAFLQNQLQLEINLGFGDRHEDEALEIYEAQIGARTYGQQVYIKVGMPAAGVAEALRRFPLPGTGTRAKIEAVAAAAASAREANASGVKDGISEAANEGPKATRQATEPSEDAYFYLTGFTDGIVDLPRQGAAGGTETLVVEVKHRMGKIKNPPNIYDVVQLSTYCHVLGCARGQLVQCLRQKDDSSGSNREHELSVTTLDFSPGSPDRRGFDEHVLPSLYKVASAVYAMRDDEVKRLELLRASDPAARRALVCQLCPHFDK